MNAKLYSNFAPIPHESQSLPSDNSAHKVETVFQIFHCGTLLTDSSCKQCRRDATRNVGHTVRRSRTPPLLCSNVKVSVCRIRDGRAQRLTSTVEVTASASLTAVEATASFWHLPRRPARALVHTFFTTFVVCH